MMEEQRDMIETLRATVDEQQEQIKTLSSACLDLQDAAKLAENTQADVSKHTEVIEALHVTVKEQHSVIGELRELAVVEHDPVGYRVARRRLVEPRARVVRAAAVAVSVARPRGGRAARLGPRHLRKNVRSPYRPGKKGRVSRAPRPS